MREIMNKEQLCEYLGIKMEGFGSLFPAPPCFNIAKEEKFQMGEIQQWLSEIIDTQHQAKARRAKDKFMTAQKYFLEKNYSEAATFQKEAIALDRSNADYHFNYGFSLFHLEEFDDCEIEMRKALELNPKGEWRDAARHYIEIVEKKRFESKNAIDENNVEQALENNETAQ